MQARSARSFCFSLGGVPVTGVSLAVALPPEEAPVDGLGLRLDAVHEVVAICQQDLDSSGEHAKREQVVAPQTVFDQAELLRHRLRAAAVEAAELLAQVRDLEQRPGVVRIPISPVTVTVAVATAASSLHAAVHAMNPAASGLCRGEQLAATVDASLCASRRFLGALLDAARLLRITQPGMDHPPPTGGHRPYLRLVSDPDRPADEPRGTMKIHRRTSVGAQAPRAALETQRAARLQDTLRADELAHVQRLQDAQLRQEQADLAKEGVDRERRDAPRTLNGP